MMKIQKKFYIYLDMVFNLVVKDYQKILKAIKIENVYRFILWDRLKFTKPT